MKRASIIGLVAAACCCMGGGAMAQGYGIPQGLSGPGGTVQFSPAPAMPAVGPSANVYGAPGVSRSGAIGLPVRGGGHHRGHARRAVKHR